MINERRRAEDQLRKASKERGTPRRRRPSDARLYEAVVVVKDQPPCYAHVRFWFVVQFVPDVMWCHLCPLRRDGRFDATSGRRNGRHRYVLPPEGSDERELDIAASRCVLVRSTMTLNTEDANDEVWDVEDPQKPPRPDLFPRHKSLFRDA